MGCHDSINILPCVKGFLLKCKKTHFLQKFRLHLVKPGFLTNNIRAYWKRKKEGKLIEVHIKSQVCDFLIQHFLSIAIKFSFASIYIYTHMNALIIFHLKIDISMNNVNFPIQSTSPTTQLNTFLQCTGIPSVIIITNQADFHEVFLVTNSNRKTPSPWI